MSQLLTINLSKGPGVSWGFRLQGGKDFAQPLCIQKVTPGSVSAQAGVQSGDAIVRIGAEDALSLRHKEAQDAIIRAGNSFVMQIQRGTITWKPAVTALAQPKQTPEGPVATQTSLAAAGKGLAPTKYNSPIGLYTDENIAEALTAQAEVINPQAATKGCLGINFRKFEREIKLRTDSPTYQMLHGDDSAAAPKQRKQLPPPEEEEEKPVFPTAQPGKQGYYNVNDKLYCDVHAKQAAGQNPPAPNMVPVTVKPGAPIPSGAAIVPPEPQATSTDEQTILVEETPSQVEEKPIANFNIDPIVDCKIATPPIVPQQIELETVLETQQTNTDADNVLNEVCEKLQSQIIPETEEAVPHEQIETEPEIQSEEPIPEPEIEQIETIEKLVQTEEVAETQSTTISEVMQESITIDAGVNTFKPIEAPTFTEPKLEDITPKPMPSFEPVSTFTPKAPVQSCPPVGATSANPQAFGAVAGDVDIRSHIPKKDPVVPAPIQRAVAPPAQAAAPPKPSPMFGGNMPMPSSMPGMNPPKPAGIGAVPTKGVPGERTAPKRGRGVMNQAVASRIPVCANCQIQIRGPFVTALGKNWCPDHFCCATTTCRKQLLDVGFVEEQGALHCEDCYEKFFAPTCGKCDKRIKGDCLNAVGKQFHPECFCCAYCGKVFGSGAFYLEDGLPYCETDWNDLFTTKCVGCGFPIEAGDRWVEALNNNYHSQCFKCSKCNKNLEGQSFYAKGGKPFCKSHAQRGF